MVDWIVVGAGFTGATVAERLASQLNQRVLVVERRNHIAGNAYDSRNVEGMLVHRYGPHIFHTNSPRVWRYIRQFSEWRPYEHHVRIVIDGREVPLPFNLNTMEALFPADAAQRLAEKLLSRFGQGARVPILRLMTEPDETLRELADYIYDKVFRNYTLKQWGLTPEQLSPSVTARVPIVVGRDNRYFQDRFQAMPAAGYTAMFERMLDHRNISLMLGTDFRAIANRYKSARIIYTGPIDEYFDYQLGALPYRTMRFEEQVLESEQIQGCGTVNYPGSEKFTRVTEMKHLTGDVGPRTTLLYEHPMAHVPGVTEPHYPIPREETQNLVNRYRELAGKRDDILFCGRLGEYRYYNMDQAIGAALALVRTLVPSVGLPA